jgi:hypothetical protein
MPYLKAIVNASSFDPYGPGGYMETEPGASGEADAAQDEAPDAAGLSFSTVRLSRDDPREKHLVSMLLGSEPDLEAFREPMAFPVFGRGRVLYALVGKGINEEYVDEACAFLAGPCSCQVKELNPGTDLLMAVDWEALLGERLVEAAELPPLTGLAAPPAPSAEVEAARAPSPEIEDVQARSAGGEDGAGARGGQAPPAADGEGPPAGGRILAALLAAGGVCAVLLAAGTFLMLRRKR